MKGALVSTILALALALAPASASAVTRVVPAGVARSPVLDTYQSWIDESAMPSPPIEVPVALVECDRISSACTQGIGGRLYVRFPDFAYLSEPEYAPADWEATRLEFMHEIGHVFSFTLRAPMRLGQSAERFADAYAYCSVAPKRITRSLLRIYPGYGYYRPSPREHRATCDAIRHTAAREDWPMAL